MATIVGDGDTGGFSLWYGAMEGVLQTDTVVDLPSLRLERVTQSASGPFRRTHVVDRPSLIYLPPPFREPARGCIGTPESIRSFHALGPAILVPARVPVHVESPGFESRTMLVLRFREEDFERLVGTAVADALDSSLLLGCLDVRGHGVMETIDHIFRELEGCAVGRDTILAGLALVLSGELARYFDALREPPARTGALTDRQMRLAAVRLADPSRPPPSVGELAAACGVGRRHLMRAFKARTGLTVMAWVEQATFARATRLLEEGSLSIKAIAARLGYARAGSFATAFTRRFGVPPRRWRAQQARRH